MATALNGTPYFSIWPAGSRPDYEDTDNQNLMSVNSPNICQVLVQYGSAGLTDPPANEGDVVNVLFDVYAKKNSNMVSMVAEENRIATIRKGMDIKFDYEWGQSLQSLGSPWSLTDGSLNVKIFTVDIAPLLRTHLDYSLVPCGRGSFNQHEIEGELGGGFNGRYGDTTYGTLNGGLLHVWVRARFEVLTDEGLIEVAMTSLTQEKILYPSTMWDGSTSYSYEVINSVTQPYEDQRKEMAYQMRALTSGSTDYKFLSNAPNGDDSADWSEPRHYKSIRMDEQTENLYFFLFAVPMSTTLTTYSGQYPFQSRVWRMYFLCQARTFGGGISSKDLDTEDDCFYFSVGHNQMDSASYGFNPDDITKYLTSRKYTKMWLAQNISPEYINNNTSTTTGVTTLIDSDTEYYRVAIGWDDNESGICCCTGPCGAITNAADCVAAGCDWDESNSIISEWRYYKVDHSSQNDAFPYIRFHWLNRMGGIDSYTCKRNQTETIKKTFSTFEKKPNTPQWLLESSSKTAQTEGMYDNTWSPEMNQRNLSIRSEQYQTEVETLDIQARKSGTVYSEPLNQVNARWLEEIITSPNVWIETDITYPYPGSVESRGEQAKDTNPFAHPIPNDYIPVTITNTEQQIINSSDDARLVQFLITYEMGNSMKTQSN